MTTITLTSSQSRLLSHAEGPVAVCNDAGQQIGFILFEPGATADLDLAAEEVEELVSRTSMTNPKWLTIDEVVEHSDERRAD